MKLFTVVTLRDDLVMGWTEEEFEDLPSAGPPPVTDIDRLAAAADELGYLAGWHYTVTRAPEGQLRLSADQRTAVMLGALIRIEPHVPAHEVAP